MGDILKLNKTWIYYWKDVRFPAIFKIKYKPPKDSLPKGHTEFDLLMGLLSGKVKLSQFFFEDCAKDGNFWTL